MPSTNNKKPVPLKSLWDPGLTFIMVKILKLVQTILDLFLDLIIGTTTSGGSRGERIEAENDFDRSGHLVEVLWRGAWGYSTVLSQSNFLYRHLAYISPREVLDRTDITLCSLTDDRKAIFCVSDGFDVYDSSLIPFVFVAHFIKAKKLIIMDFDALIKVG